MRASGHRSNAWVALWLAAALMTMLLTGCGAAGAVGGGSSGRPGVTTPSGTVPPPCAGAPVGGATPHVTLGVSDENHTVSVPVGDVVEIRLDGQHVWRPGSVSPASALTPIGPQGVLEQGACVWEFRVARPGDAVVTFIGTALCPPNTMCPQYALVARFALHGV